MKHHTSNPAIRAEHIAERYTENVVIGYFEMWLEIYWIVLREFAYPEELP